MRDVESIRVIAAHARPFVGARRSGDCIGALYQLIGLNFLLSNFASSPIIRRDASVLFFWGGGRRNKRGANWDENAHNGVN